MIRISPLSCSLAALVLLSLPGCSGEERPEVVPVSGKVYMNGKVLTGYPGNIVVEPANARAAQGRINAVDGSFKLETFGDNDGCVPGEHPVAVIITTTEGTETVSLIPEKYMQTSTSGLTVKITGPTDDLKIELEGELKPRPKPSEKQDDGDDPGPGVG